MKTTKILNIFYDTNDFITEDYFSEKNINRILGIGSIIITSLIILYFISGGTPPASPDFMQDTTLTLNLIKETTKITKEVITPIVQAKEPDYLELLQIITGAKNIF